MTNETSSLVWSTSHSHAKDLVEMDEEAFASEINTAFVSTVVMKNKSTMMKTKIWPKYYDESFLGVPAVE